MSERGAPPRRTSLAAGLGLWAGLALAPVAAETLDEGGIPNEAAIDAAVQAILAVPLPQSRQGDVAAVPALEERDLRRGFRADLEALADWPGEAVVLANGVMRLEAVAAALARPDLLACEASSCRLAAPLMVDGEATLVIHDTTVRMVQSAGALLSAQGDLVISDAEILGWDETADAPAATDLGGSVFRPWVAGLEANRTTIRNSRLAHLGYLSSAAQGLAFTTAGRDPPAGRPSVDIVSSRIEDLYYGFYTWEARGVRLLQNIFEGNQLYGIDPHDRTSDMLIAENFVRNTQYRHGIVLSREIHDTLVVRNRSIENAGAGFFLEKGGRNVTFASNESFDNGTDGFTILESHDVDIVGNHVAENGRNGIRIRASADILIQGNIIHDNLGPGIFAYGWKDNVRQPNAEERHYMQPVRVTIAGNRLSNNKGGDCNLRGDVTLVRPPEGRGDC